MFASFTEEWQYITDIQINILKAIFHRLENPLMKFRPNHNSP